MKSVIKADTETVDKKHSGKFISHLTFDVPMITKLVSTGILSIFKDTFLLLGLVAVMFYQNWRLALFALIMIPLASFAARSLDWESLTEAQEKSGVLTAYLLEIFKNHKIIKIFQKENYEFNRAENFIDKLKEKKKKFNLLLSERLQLWKH